MLSQNWIFSVKLSLAFKNAKIRLFRQFWVKTLIIRYLSRYSLKIPVLERVFDLVKLQRRPFCIATEPLLHFNGATFGLQRSLRYTPKWPKTHSKSASVESQQTLNRAKTAFSRVFSDVIFWRKSRQFFSNGGTFGILNYEFWVLNWDFWGRKTVGNE